ncbi:unnamed protein product, partial [marine sediment metagenome]
MSGRIDVAQAPLAAGADVSAIDEYGQTPLDMADKCGHSEVAGLLRR